MTRWVTKQGYYMTKRGLEHRVVMEVHLGRYLRSDEIVHHKDGNPLNNALDNLEVMTYRHHRRRHSGTKRKRCPVCREFVPRKVSVYCSRNCMREGMKEPPKVCWECKQKFHGGAKNHRRNRFCGRECYNALVRRMGLNKYRALLKEVVP
jgi:hypothetical protein